MSAKATKPASAVRSSVDVDGLMRKHQKRNVDVSFWGGISVDPDTIRIRRESAEISLAQLEALAQKRKSAPR
jgi:hypothetical protein